MVVSLTPAFFRSEKRKVTESEIELQKLEYLKQMSASVNSGFSQPCDSAAAFGQQVAAELRAIQDPVTLARLKKNIMNLVYDTLEATLNTPPPTYTTPSTSTYIAPHPIYQNQQYLHTQHARQEHPVSYRQMLNDE